MSIEDDIVRLEEEIFSSKGWDISEKVYILKDSYYVFQKNSEDLEKLILLFEDNRDKAIKLRTEHTEQYNDYLREVTRLLHNYLASAKTLVDHTRVLYQGEYKGTDFIEKYEKKLKFYFIDNVEARFIQDLRNFTLHRALPVTSSELEIKEEINFFVSLKKKTLLQWKGWSPKAKEFLDSNDRNINLRDVTNAYSNTVKKFYDWLAQAQIEFHKKDIKLLTSLQEKLDEKLRASGWTDQED